jgi:hypothetical protein
MKTYLVIVPESGKIEQSEGTGKYFATATDAKALFCVMENHAVAPKMAEAVQFIQAITMYYLSERELVKNRSFFFGSSKELQLTRKNKKEAVQL